MRQGSRRRSSSPSASIDWRKIIGQSSYPIVGRRFAGHAFGVLPVGTAGLGLVQLIIGLCVSLLAQASDSHTFDIPKQRADLALIEFAEQADRTLLFSYDETSNRMANRLSGPYEVVEALKLLLAGTGLSISMGNDGQLSVASSDIESEESNVRMGKSKDQQSVVGRIGAVVTSLLLGAGAVAEDADPGSANANIIEEIVVTAQKREQTAQETALALSAYTSDTVLTRQIDGVRRISQLAPSLVFNRSGTAANTYMRGVGQDIATVLGEPGVALFIDGVYQAANFAQTASYNDLERIEVLRGPQGTLYGRNTTGGNINLYTKRPGFEQGFEASLLYGDYDRIKATIAGQTTLVKDRVAVRGSFVTDTNDGYRDNPFDGSEIEERDIQAGAVSLLVAPSDTIELLLRADWNDQDDDNPVWDYLEAVPGSGLSPQLFGGNAAPGGNEVISERDSQVQTEHWGVSADLTWDINEISVRSITAYRESKQDVDYDNDGTDLPFFDTSGGQSSEQFSQEINVSGLALDGNLEWIAGVFYMEQDINIVWNFDLEALQGFFESVFPNIQNSFMPPLPPGGLGDPTLNPLYSGRLPSGMGSAVPFLDFSNQLDVDSSAVFVQGTLSLTDAWRVTAGVRYTDDEKTTLQSVTSNVSPAVCQDLRLSEDWQETTWKLGVDWDLADNVLVYALASRGFKSGGFNTGRCNNSYDPETIDAYEVGLKSTLADGRVRLNLAAFAYDYQDLQATLFVNNASLLDNATDTEMQGIEAEMLVLAGAGFEFDAQVSWMNTEYIDFVTTNPMTGMVQDASGNQVLRAPDFSYNLGVQYTMDVSGSGALTLRYEASHKDDYYTTVFNDDFAKVDAYTLQNVRVIWNTGGAWEIQGFVENLTDEEYIENQLAVATVGGVIGSWAPPRTWGLQVRYRTGAYQ